MVYVLKSLQNRINANSVADAALAFFEGEKISRPNTDLVALQTAGRKLAFFYAGRSFFLAIASPRQEAVSVCCRTSEVAIKVLHSSAEHGTLALIRSDIIALHTGLEIKLGDGATQYRMALKKC